MAEKKINKSGKEIDSDGINNLLYNTEEIEKLSQKITGLYQEGRYDDAIPYAKRRLEILETIFGKDHPDVATNLNNLAVLYYSMGRFSEAEPLYKRSLKISEKVLGKYHPDITASLNNLAELYKSTGRYSEAEPLSLVIG